MDSAIGDPGFRYHAAMVQFWGVMAMRLATWRYKGTWRSRELLAALLLCAFMLLLLQSSLDEVFNPRLRRR